MLALASAILWKPVQKHRLKILLKLIFWQKMRPSKQKPTESSYNPKKTPTTTTQKPGSFQFDCSYSCPDCFAYDSV